MPTAPLLARKAGLSRWLLVILGLLAMSAQSLLVQTHIHGPGKSASHMAIADTSGTAPSLAQVPDDLPAPALPLPDDSIKCPLCQQWHGAGQFVGPSASLLSLPLLVHLGLTVLDDPAFAVQVVAHAWHGRAPPNT
jgi:hypothetical protein